MIAISSGGVDSLGASTPVGPARPPVPRPRRRFWSAVLAVFSVVTISTVSLAGLVDANGKEDATAEEVRQVRAARTMLLALIDAETAVRGYALTQHPIYLQPYYAAVPVLTNQVQDTIGRLDGPGPDHTSDPRSVATRVKYELQLWQDTIAATGHQPVAALAAMLEGRGDKVVMDTLRADLGRYIDTHLRATAQRQIDLDIREDYLLLLNALGGVVTVWALVSAFYRSGRETARRERAMADALQSREQAIAGREEVRQVFAMAEALQSASDLPDGAAVLRSAACRLLPRFGGSLYAFNQLRDRLDLVIAWDIQADADEPHALHCAHAAPAFLIPSECWALKRSKPHLNGQGADALRCCHAPLDACSLEVPMVGRGDALGLLILHATGPDAGDRLLRASDIACVLADSMSLALSSIMLREKLRSQAVRDSLTGLYNRRFLEEVLQTLTLQAQRRHAALSAIMIDLDHFKRLNDEHGHAMGDSVLKAAAAAICGTLRASDVACRYGGEELLVLLPDCTLEMARAKAEQIRDRICRLTRDGGPQVSASLGVSTIPNSARDADDLLSTADAALYQAKQAGRNRVMAAAAIPPREVTDWKNPLALSPIDPGGLRLARL